MTEEPIRLFATRAERYPEPESADVLQSVGRAALSVIPVVGGPATELLSLVLAPAVARRRDEWFKELADALDRVEGQVEGFDIGNLVNNEPFVSAVIQATRSAIATHQLEKRTMLRNSLLNIALGKGPKEELQEVFIATIDALSFYHIKILNFMWTGVTELNKAGKWDPIRPNSVVNYTTAITALYPELKGQDDLLLYIMTDLKSRGLSKVSAPWDSYPQSPGVTNMGIQFLQFIVVPPETLEVD